MRRGDAEVPVAPPFLVVALLLPLLFTFTLTVDLFFHVSFIDFLLSALPAFLTSLLPFLVLRVLNEANLTTTPCGKGRQKSHQETCT